MLTGLVEGASNDVAQWLRWYRPRLQLSATAVTDTLSQAELLGFAFGGSPAAVRLLDPARRDDPTALAQAVSEHLPALTDRIILQADLTATALGPLQPAVERRLTAVADWESGGAATVFRFTAETIRAALARGATAPELLAWLNTVSATPVPQALSVLISDQARALPSMAVHDAGSVVTCDPADAAALLADPAVAALGLRQVAAGGADRIGDSRRSCAGAAGIRSGCCPS